MVISDSTQNKDGIVTRIRREIPFVPFDIKEPSFEKLLNCSVIAFAYNATVSKGVSKAKVATESKEVLFKKSNKLTYTVEEEVEEAYVEFSLNKPIEVATGMELTIPMKGDFTHNKFQLKYVNEDASDSIYADSIVLSSFNWKMYNAKVVDIPEDGKRWYLSALHVVKTGHPANGFNGEFYIENIYLGRYELPVGIEHVVGDGVSVWPNPATEFVYVDAPANASIDVYSVDGRLITSIPANSALKNNLTRQIDIYNLIAGVYVVNITTEQGVQSLKFVKE